MMVGCKSHLVFWIASLTLAMTVIFSSASVKAQVLDIQEITTEGGITAWLVEDDTVPILSLQFAFRGSGSVNDTIGTQGLARLTSQMMTQGAGDLDATAFQKARKDRSVSLSFNAGRDHFFGTMKTLSKHQDKAFELLKLALYQPRFEQADLDRMRKSNQSRIRSSLTDPQWIAARISNDFAFAGQAYAMNSGGTLSSLDAIQPDDLREFHSQYLGKKNLVVAASGNIDAETLSTLLDDVFGDLPDVEVAGADNFELANQGKIAFYEKDIPQSIIEIHHPGIARDLGADNENDDYFLATVMNYVLGGSGFGSRLMEEIREKRGLTYGVYSSLQGYDATALLNVGTSTKNENVPEMLRLIKNEFRSLRNRGISASELRTAKSYLIGSLPLSLTSTNKISNLLLSLQLDDLPVDYLSRREDAIAEMSLDTVNDFVRTALDVDAFTTIIVGNPIRNETDPFLAGDNIVTYDSLPNVE